MRVGITGVRAVLGCCHTRVIGSDEQRRSKRMYFWSRFRKVPTGAKRKQRIKAGLASIGT